MSSTLTLTITLSVVTVTLLRSGVDGKCVILCIWSGVTRPGVTELLMMGCNCEHIQHLGILTPSRSGDRDTGNRHPSCGQPGETWQTCFRVKLIFKIIL